MRRRSPTDAQGFFDRLEVLVPELVTRWGLCGVEPLSGGVMSAVCASRRPDGTEVVLKVPAEVELAAAEVAQLDAWAATGAERRWPEVLEFDPENGAFLMRRCAGVPAHRAGAASSSAVAAGVAEFTATVAASTAPAGLPSAAELLAAPMFAAASQLAVDGSLGGWRRVFSERRDALDELSAGNLVACHGDLWAGNMLVDTATEAVWVLDPAPCAARVEFDVARVAADGWNGPGFAERVALLCTATGAERALVERVAAVVACAQVFTFARHRWDPSPIAAGIADVAATLGLDVERPGDAGWPSFDE